MECNGGVFGLYGEKYIIPEEDSYMTNPNLTVIVPIAPGESDVEFLEEETSDTSEDEDNQPVRFFFSLQNHFNPSVFLGGGFAAVNNTFNFEVLKVTFSFQGLKENNGWASEIMEEERKSF